MGLTAPLRSDFLHEIASVPRGYGVLKCIQCGRCASSCPVARVVPEHNPRKLIEAIILGLRSEVVPTKLPWYCLSCFTCLDRCPQGGDAGEVMFAIRNVAATEGNVPSGLLLQVRSLAETGRIVNPTKIALRERERYKLGGLPSVDVEAVRKVLSRTSLVKFVR